jgi:alpha-tubulin suppressor-like RCC1 family protein
MKRPVSFASPPRSIAGLVAVLVAALLASLAGAAPEGRLATAVSGVKLYAHLTRTDFTVPDAGSVELVFKFSKPRETLAYELAVRSGSKWKTLESVKKKGHFKGQKSMTVTRLFAGKAVRIGSYRLTLFGGERTKYISFEIEQALSGAVAVSMGRSHACAVLLPDGTVECWGLDEAGELGDGLQHKTDKGGNDFSPVPVPVRGITNATAVATGDSHSCAVVQGEVWCWGGNLYGQLGDGTNDGSPTPVQVSGITNAAQVSAGGAVTCAVLSSGAIDCWGADYFGQLGDGTGGGFTRGSSTPVQVVGITNAIQVRAGADHICALISNGTIECWGNNQAGDLGDGVTDHGYKNGGRDFSPTPVRVEGITSATSVGAGQAHTCASLADGTVECWGDNRYGQLGEGNYGNGTPGSNFSPTPVQVPGIADAASVSAGGWFTCALLSGSTIECWGQNWRGQLGNHSPTKGAPVKVEGIGNAASISAAWEDACALLAPGSIKCWGDNWEGQLGDGSHGNASIAPVAVKSTASS